MKLSDVFFVASSLPPVAHGGMYGIHILTP